MYYISLVGKAVKILLLIFLCQIGGGVIACLIIGALLEAFTIITLDDRGNLVFKEILYYGGLLLQIVPLFVISAQFLSLPNSEMNLIHAISVGWIGLECVVCWFLTGYKGMVGLGYLYGFSVLYIIAMALINVMCGYNYHGLLIANIVIAAVGCAVIVLARLIKGSNME